MNLDPKSCLVGTLGAGLADVGAILPVQFSRITGANLWEANSSLLTVWLCAVTFLCGLIMGLWMAGGGRWRQAIVIFFVVLAVGAGIGIGLIALSEGL